MTDAIEKICKVVLLGESGVGKSSIINRIVDQTFETPLLSTNTAHYSSIYLTINGKKAKFNIWDTAGQEKYRSLTSMFYKDASAIILVYDITVLQSFEEIEKYWVKQVQEMCSPHVIIAVAANKADLFEEEKVNEETARKFAKENNAIFKSTSALTEKGIEILFEEIGKQFFKEAEVNPVKNEWDDYVKIDSIKDKKGKAHKSKSWC